MNVNTAQGDNHISVYAVGEDIILPHFCEIEGILIFKNHKKLAVQKSQIMSFF